MNRLTATSLAGFIAAAAISASAQSLNVTLAEGTTYSFPASGDKDISFETREENGISSRFIAIRGESFDLSRVTRIHVDPTVLPDNNVVVTYDGTKASVVVAGNIARFVTATIDGANVKLIQSTDVNETTCNEITYTLSGSSPDGSMTLTGDYKATVVLNGLTLTSSTGAPLYIDNGKRIALKLTEGTANSLTDTAGGSHKGALTCKGHLEIKQKGSLEVTGRTAHGIFAKEYIELKNATVTIIDAVKDGINCNQYFSMQSGTLDIRHSGDDGLQVSYKDATDREAEDTGSITITGGTLTITNSGLAAKCIKADNAIDITGGTFTLSTSGNGMYDTTDLKTKAAACIGADGNVNIGGGTLSLKSTGSGAKGVTCDGTFTMTDGKLDIVTSGGMYVYKSGTEYHNYTSNADNIAANNKSSAKGVKGDSGVTIDGGTIRIYTSGTGAEGIESKATLTVNGGDITIKAYDDGMNSSSHFYVKGGTLNVVSTVGDGLDSNGSIFISGGTTCTYGARSPECGLDAGTESGYTVVFTGGTVLAIGGGNSAPTTTASTQAFVSLSKTVTAGQTVTIKDGTDELASFVVPAWYGTTTVTPFTGAPAMFGPGGGFGGSNGGGMIITTPAMVSGKSYSITAGTSTSTATSKLK